LSLAMREAKSSRDLAEPIPDDVVGARRRS
jgi:hypothetical protein